MIDRVLDNPPAVNASSTDQRHVRAGQDRIVVSLVIKARLARG